MYKIYRWNGDSVGVGLFSERKEFRLGVFGDRMSWKCWDVRNLSSKIFKDGNMPVHWNTLRALPTAAILFQTPEKSFPKGNSVFVALGLLCIKYVARFDGFEHGSVERFCMSVIWHSLSLALHERKSFDFLISYTSYNANKNCAFMNSKRNIFPAHPTRPVGITRIYITSEFQ
jgi:hypothetical protein